MVQTVGQDQRDQSKLVFAQRQASDWINKNSTGTSAPLATHGPGLLGFSSATALTFIPFRGSVIKINGQAYDIPTGGIAGLANTSIFLEGVAAQNLGASTLYYVYAFVNSGVVTADFSTTARATSTTVGNQGTEIKTGDDTRSLIGLVFTNASNQFTNSMTLRNTRSWFNRDAEILNFANAFTTARATTSNTFTEINTEIRCEFTIWITDTVVAACNGNSFNTAPGYAISAFGWDGTASSSPIVASASVGASGGSVGLTENKSGLAEGHHYVTLMGRRETVSAGTATWDNAAAPTSISGQIIP